MDLDEALQLFDATEANLRRLEAVWAELEQLVPDGISFGDSHPEGRRYRELSRAFSEIAAALPPVDDYRIDQIPWDLNDIAQGRLDAAELGEAAVAMSVEDGIEAPGRGIDEYRHRLNKSRRQLVRDHVAVVEGEIDRLLAALSATVAQDSEAFVHPDFPSLSERFSQLERLVGGQVPRTKSWQTLQRHLAFGQGVDLHDIAARDWPLVRGEIESNLYSDLEPVPVAQVDLGTIVTTKPRGVVTTALNWRALSDADFERLLFSIVSDAAGYQNPAWLTKTDAPDRGRDISVDRVLADSLGVTRTERVIIQAKHWQSKSVDLPAVAALVAQMPLWEPPRVDVLIIATSGRFVADAVAWIERHNYDASRPYVEMWPDSHLEFLLHSRPHLVAGFGLR